MILAPRRTMRWKNGGGLTHELWRTPPEPADFDVRLSLAEVAVDGPFSTFSGVDRVITLVWGAGFRLTGPAGRHDVTTLGAPLAFPGDAPWSCSLVNGPIRDFNVMVRRASGVRARVLSLATGRLPPGARFVLALGAQVAVGPEGALIPLAPETLAVLEGADTHLFVAAGLALVVTLHAQSGPDWSPATATNPFVG